MVSRNPLLSTRIIRRCNTFRPRACSVDAFLAGHKRSTTTKIMWCIVRAGKTLCDALSRRAEHAVGCRTADLETSALLRPIFFSPLYLSLSLLLLVRHEDPSRTVASIAMKIAVEIHLELALKPVHDPCSRQRSKISWTVDF